MSRFIADYPLGVCPCTYLSSSKSNASGVQVFRMVLGLKIKQHRMRNTLLDTPHAELASDDHHGRVEAEQPRAALA